MPGAASIYNQSKQFEPFVSTGVGNHQMMSCLPGEPFFSHTYPSAIDLRPSTPPHEILQGGQPTLHKNYCTENTTDDDIDDGGLTLFQAWGPILLNYSAL